MTDQDKKLSHLLDDYAGDNDAAALDEVIGDVNLQYQARRYRMIGEVMRHELPRAIDPGFHTAVMARLRQQPEAVHSSLPDFPARAGFRPSLSNWARFKPFAGLAVAASVALVTVALWQPLEQESRPLDGGLASAEQQKIVQLAERRVAGAIVPANAQLRTLGTRWKLEREMPGMQQKLNAYLVTHTEYSNPVQGIIPQARVAGFDSQQ